MPALQDSINAVRVAAEAADRIKATDIVAFDVADLLGITDIMMIAGASNERQVLAVAEEIEKDLFLKCSGRQPRSREGLTEGQWVLLDYGDFVIHVMHEESSLWPIMFVPFSLSVMDALPITPLTSSKARSTFRWTPWVNGRSSRPPRP